MTGMINKGKALFVTVGFLAVITTNAEPKMWQVGLIAILIYEAVLMFIRTWQQATRKRAKRLNIAAGQRDMERVAKVRFGWPMKEVS